MQNLQNFWFFHKLVLPSLWLHETEIFSICHSLATVRTFYFGRSKYLGSCWLYQKTKGTLWSPTSRDLSDSTTGSPLNSTRKKLQRPKLKKSQMAPWKWRFSPHDFLGWQQSLCNINFSFGLFMSEYQRKNLLKCTTAIAESNREILMASFWQQFLHSKRNFWLKPTIPEKFYIFWGWDEPKILQLSLTVLIHERNAFTWSAIFFALNFI